MRQLITPMILGGFLLLAAPSGWAQDEQPVRFGALIVNQTTVLRAKPSNGASVLRTLPKTTTLRWINGQRKGNFFRVFGPKGPQGWVSTSDVQITTATPPPVLTAASAPPCVANRNLDACPSNGCGTPNSTQAIVNEAKRRDPIGTTPVDMTFADFSSLQDQADLLVDQGTELTQAERESLSGLTVSGGTVQEGNLVRITGFIVFDSKPHANSGESVNCRLKTEANNDFHISLAEQASDSEAEGIVVEMIPQHRPSNWTLAKLTATKNARKRVLVVGSLFYDNKHVVNSDPENPVPRQPARFSLWEVHRITEFFVCKKAANTCDPTKASDWKQL